MSQKFKDNNREIASSQHIRKKVISILSQHRDLILGTAWLGYLRFGVGAVQVTEIKGQCKLDYIPRDRIGDSEIVKRLNENKPQLSAIVLYSYGNGLYEIITLSGPKTTVEYYAELPASLKQSS